MFYFRSNRWALGGFDSSIAQTKVSVERNNFIPPPTRFVNVRDDCESIFSDFPQLLWRTALFTRIDPSLIGAF